MSDRGDRAVAITGANGYVGSTLSAAFAAAGYAAIRVDMRGSGDSDGLMQDEYTAQEWADAVEIIRRADTVLVHKAAAAVTN